ncbi:glycosyltransferase family 2 protein [Companilactobacillus zhachilii]|uniref:glycosyltransferase family 2 protein n=1 Tax=Companilactobacillus zhachilii TaxID=2304606 RepID=UPI0019235EDF|nr:glycosyltransferase family 2 protein [Companilactobacillus zhachilii]MBL3532020.1 glycosyltransferase family 2 protein [Companilactobacillus zhachilii]
MKKMINIIVPTHNSRKTIIRALRSVDNILRKETSNLGFCVWIVDDHSCDDTVFTIKKIWGHNKKIHLLESEGYGVSAARNIALRRIYEESSDNDYVLFLDSDDMLLPSFFDSLHEILNVGYDYISFYFEIKNNDNLNFQMDNEKLLISKINVDKALNIAITGIDSKKINFNSPWGRIIKVGFLKFNNLFFDERLSYKEDLLFNITILSLNPNVCLVNKYGYVHFINPDSVINNYIPTALHDELVFQKEVLKFKLNKELLAHLKYNGWRSLQYVYVFPKGSIVDSYSKRMNRYSNVRNVFIPYTLIRYKGKKNSKDFFFFLMYMINLFPVLNFCFHFRQGR